jgi:hypothetical protein
LTNLDERKVLKVKTDKPDIEPQGPPMGNDFPPQEQENDFGGDEMEPMNGGEENENPFDNNFDAGVGDENDPKYIERLVGKLSQKIRDNAKDGSIDADKVKYVLGMVASAANATGELDDTDKQEIIKKLNGEGGDNNESEPVDNEVGNEMQPNIPEQPENDGMPMEGKKGKIVYLNEDQYRFIMDQFGGGFEPEKPRIEKELPKDVRRGIKSKPYLAPTFK